MTLSTLIFNFNKKSQKSVIESYNFLSILFIQTQDEAYARFYIC